MSPQDAAENFEHHLQRKGTIYNSKGTLSK